MSHLSDDGHHRTTASRSQAHVTARHGALVPVLWAERSRPRDAVRRTDGVRQRRGSDAKRCGLRSVHVGRQASQVPGRAETGRRRNNLEPCGQDDRPPVRGWRTPQVFLQSAAKPLDRVFTGIVPRDVLAAVPLVMTAALGGRVGITPSQAELGGTGPSGKQQHDSQDDGAEHDQLSHAVEQEWRRSGPHREWHVFEGCRLSRGSRPPEVRRHFAPSAPKIPRHVGRPPLLGRSAGTAEEPWWTHAFARALCSASTVQPA